MKDIKRLNVMEMEMVNGGEAMEACDEFEEVEVIEESEAFDACDAKIVYDNFGRRGIRTKTYKPVRVNGKIKYMPCYTWEYLDDKK